MNKMKFSEQLFNEVREIWEGYLNHSFVEEMGEGTLPKEKFKNYLIQDFLYLKEYSKIFCMGVVRATNMEDMKFFYKSVGGILEGETHVHIKYLEEFGLKTCDVEKMKSKLPNLSYTGYMLGKALTGNLKEIAIVTLACTWSYDYIGRYLWNTYKNNLENNFYKEWIESYSSLEGNEFASSWINYVDKLCEGISEDEKKKLIEIFLRCSQYEMDFWNMAYSN